MPVVIVYAGALAALVGFVSLWKPLRFLGIRTRRRGALLFAGGLLLAVASVALPAPLNRSRGHETRLDDAIPEYHFGEAHSIRVNASADRVFRAIKAVTAEDIRFFRTLMGLRNLPARLLGGGGAPAPMTGYSVEAREQSDADAHDFAVGEAGGEAKRVLGRKAAITYGLEDGAQAAGPDQIRRTHEKAVVKLGGSVISRDGCCRSTLRLGKDASAVWIEVAAEEGGARYRLTVVEEGGPMEKQPILDVFTRSDFSLLAEDDHEILLGGMLPFGGAGREGAPPRSAGPREFLAFDRPGYVKVGFNFSLRDDGAGWCRLSTQTRVLATDASARRVFAAYWRVIYPGSAIIRREWLKAVKRRAEG